MTINQIVMNMEGNSLAVSARNRLGFSLTIPITQDQLGQDGVAALGVLRSKAQGLLPPDPPAAVLDQIRDLEAQLTDLRKQAGITPPEILL